MREVYSKNPVLGYFNVNALRNKIVSLRDVVAKVPIDILCINETKLVDSVPDSQFLIENYQFLPFCRDEGGPTGGGKIVYVRQGLISKILRILSHKPSKLSALNLQYPKRSGVCCLPIGLQILKKSLSLSRYQAV